VLRGLWLGLGVYLEMRSDDLSQLPSALTTHLTVPQVEHLPMRSATLGLD
jgi:hypothetical protein